MEKTCHVLRIKKRDEDEDEKGTSPKEEKIICSFEKDGPWHDCSSIFQESTKLAHINRLKFAGDTLDLQDQQLLQLLPRLLRSLPNLALIDISSRCLELNSIKPLEFLLISSASCSILVGVEEYKRLRAKISKHNENLRILVRLEEADKKIDDQRVGWIRTIKSLPPLTEV
jgi:hypothetical protein